MIETLLRGRRRARWAIVGSAALVLLLTFLVAFARSSPAPADGSDWPGAGLDLVLKLLAVLALAYVSLAALRRYTVGSVVGRRGGSLEVLESTPLAPNRSIYLVRAGERRLLLGVTPTQITMLATWDGELPSGRHPEGVAFSGE